MGLIINSETVYEDGAFKKVTKATPAQESGPTKAVSEIEVGTDLEEEVAPAQEAVPEQVEEAAVSTSESKRGKRGRRAAK